MPRPIISAILGSQSGGSGGGGGGGVIVGAETVFTSSPTTVTLTGDNTTAANVLTGISANQALNLGSFTVITQASVDRIVIPETGNYHIVCANAITLTNNQTLSTARARFTSRIRHNTATDPIGSPGDTYMRAQYGGSFATGSTQAEAVLALTEDDEIWFDFATNQQTNSTVASIETEIFIYQLAAAGPEGVRGAKGEQGDQGDAGTDGAAGATGDTGAAGPKGDDGDQGIQGLVGPKGDDGNDGDDGAPGDDGDDGEQGIQGIQGIQGPQGDAGAAGVTTLVALDDTPADFGTNAGYVLAANADLDGAEWVEAGGDAEYPDFVGHAGEVLTVNATEDAVDWEEDDRHINEFQLDGEYDRNDLVRYQDVLYRANKAITDADEVPAFDSDWEEISSHGIQGYGEVADELDVGMVITPTLSQPALGAGETRTTAVLFNPNSVLPQTILSPDDDGRLTAQVDGVELKFDADDDYTLTVLGPTETGTTITLSVQAAENGGSFATVKSFSGALTFNGGPQVRSNPVALTSVSDVVYSLDTDDYLDFQLVLTVGVGGLGTPNHVITTAGNHLSMLITGIVETRHILSHGIGDNSGKLVVEDSSDNSVTPIFDISGGVDMVSPTRLTGLVEDLSNTEKSAIQTKLGVSAGGDAISVVAYSARGANQSSWYSSSWGQWSGSLTSSVNDGSFTLSTDTNQKVIVPEDGVYEVTAVMYLNANNDDDGGTDFRPFAADSP